MEETVEQITVEEFLNLISPEGGLMPENADQKRRRMGRMDLWLTDTCANDYLKRLKMLYGKARDNLESCDKQIFERAQGEALALRSQIRLFEGLRQNASKRRKSV